MASHTGQTARAWPIRPKGPGAASTLLICLWTRVTQVQFPPGAPNLGLSTSEEQKGLSQQCKVGGDEDRSPEGTEVQVPVARKCLERTKKKKVGSAPPSSKLKKRSGDPPTHIDLPDVSIAASVKRSATTSTVSGTSLAASVDKSSKTSEELYGKSTVNFSSPSPNVLCGLRLRARGRDEWNSMDLL